MTSKEFMFDLSLGHGGVIKRLLPSSLPKRFGIEFYPIDTANPFKTVTYFDIPDGALTDPIKLVHPKAPTYSLRLLFSGESGTAPLLDKINLNLNELLLKVAEFRTLADYSRASKEQSEAAQTESVGKQVQKATDAILKIKKDSDEGRIRLT